VYTLPSSDPFAGSAVAWPAIDLRTA